MANKAEAVRAVFFDRDGTLNVEKNYLYRIGDFEWMPEAVEAIRYCHEKGYLVIVITNQSGVARGFYTEEDVHRLHDWMNDELKKQGTGIDAFYYCPHHEAGSVPEYTKPCGCRKPSPKLVNDAATDFGIDKAQSFFFGDADRDILCAQNAGVTGVRYTGGSLLQAVKRAIG